MGQLREQARSYKGYQTLAARNHYRSNEYHMLADSQAAPHRNAKAARVRGFRGEGGAL